MGSGTYYTVGFGIAELPDLGEDGLYKTPIGEIFDEHSIQVSYENSSKYAVVALISTIDRSSASLPEGPVPLDKLADELRDSIPAKDLRKAEATWKKVQKLAAKLDPPIILPDGQLLWLSDYD